MSLAPSPIQPASLHPAETPEDALLREMVEIQSLSGQEGPLADYLVRRMRNLGFEASIDPAGNAVGVIARPDAAGACRDIVLLGHMDTVPGAIPPRRDGDLLFGRGTVDAKGPLAAFIVAAARARLPRGIRLVVVGAVEEECATSRGARHVAAHFSPAACIIGEPSGWSGFTLGYKGRLLAEFHLRRSTAHTAGPGASVADVAAAWWEEVRRSAESLRPSARAFDRVQATLRGINTTSDGLTEEVRAVAAFRLPPQVSPAEVEQLCRAAALPQASLTFTGAEVAHVADRNNPVARALSSAIRASGATPHPKLKTGTSDLNVVGPTWNCPIAAYGPGDSSLDHTPHEHISLAEFARAIDILTFAIERLAQEIIAPAAPALP